MLQAKNCTSKAGGNTANNTYRWYRNNSLDNTILADSLYSLQGVDIIGAYGNYRCEVSNALVTDPSNAAQNLVLKSKTMRVLPFDTADFNHASLGIPLSFIFSTDCISYKYSANLSWQSGYTPSSINNDSTLYLLHYNWQYSTTLSGPYSPYVSGVSSIYPTQIGYYRVIVTDGWGNSKMMGICYNQPISCVMPGDVDVNGIVDFDDWIAWGQVDTATTGAARPYATDYPEQATSPILQTASDWSSSQLNGANAKHADCNGNGITDLG
jgi:hypothetical protein